MARDGGDWRRDGDRARCGCRSSFQHLTGTRTLTPASDRTRPLPGAAPGPRADPGSRGRHRDPLPQPGPARPSPAGDPASARARRAEAAVALARRLPGRGPFKGGGRGAELGATRSCAAVNSGLCPPAYVMGNRRGFKGPGCLYFPRSRRRLLPSLSCERLELGFSRRITKYWILAFVVRVFLAF
nr:unnamed protein product [Mus musculus]